MGVSIRESVKALQFERCSVYALGGGLGAVSGCGFIPWYWAVAVFAVLIYPARKFWKVLLLSFVITLVSGIFYRVKSENISRHFSRSGTVSGVVTIVDNRATRVSGIIPSGRLRAEFSPEEFPDMSIPVLLSLPSGLKERGVLYGDRFNVSGILTVPTSGGIRFDGSEMGGSVPSPYGENYLLAVDEAEVREGKRGFRRFCFVLREKLLVRLVSGIREPEYRSMAARLFLGASDGGNLTDRRNFVLSGIIHIFAVSGMHVGVLALVCGMLLGFLPFRIRNILLAVLVVFYVMCSGLAIPALRAGAMIAVWCLLRSFLCFTPNWNILSLSFFILCTVSPEATGELGTQYSYGITAALILVMTGLRELRRESAFQFDFMISTAKLTMHYRKQQLRLHKLITAVTASAAAFAASSMLTMYHNALFLPGSILTNIGIALITPFIFGGVIFKMLSGIICEFTDRAGGWLLEAGFTLLKGVSEFSLDVFDPGVSGQPALWLVILFYLLFFAGISCRSFRVSLPVLTAAFAVMMISPLVHLSAPDEIMILGGSSGHPPLISYLMPRQSRAVVCNLPDSWSSVVAASEIRKCGCREVEIFFSAGYSANNAGMKSFAARLFPVAFHKPSGKITGFFNRNLSAIPGRAIPEIANAGDIRLPQSSDRDSRLKWFPVSGAEIHAVKQDDGWKISGKFPGGKAFSTLIPWCNQTLVFSCVEK